MEHPFFPGPVFAWAFYAALVLVTAVAAFVDFRSKIIPKSLVLVELLPGVLFSTARVAWLGANAAAAGKTARVLFVPVSDVWTGAAAGLLYAGAGCLFGFTLFFVMWSLRTCGGGDVKWFTALGAWGGVALTLYFLMGAVVFTALIALFRKDRRARIAFAPAVLLSVVVVGLWLFRAELFGG